MSEKRIVHNYDIEKNERTPATYFVDGMIIGLVLIVCYLIYKYVDYEYLKYGLIFVFIIFGLICISNFSFIRKDNIEEEMIHRIAHINEKNEIMEEWNLYGEVSLVIGRNTKEQSVDVDLSNSEYSSMINPQHGLLNFAAGNWYIEDVSHGNEISIQKLRDMVKYKIASGRPCKLDKGDIIFISNTKLLII